MLPKTGLDLPVYGKIQGLFKAFVLSTFQGKFNFQRLFKTSPVYSSTFQACANPATLMLTATRSIPITMSVHTFRGGDII